ncbi:hypothetical protein Tco_0260576 [Tanacetum coccineum]
MSNTNTNLPTQTLSVLHNDTVSSCSTSKVQEKTHLSRSRCMKSLRAIQSQFKFLTDTLQDLVISKEDLKGTRIEHGFKRAFMSLFGQDDDTFTRTMLLNVDQLQKQLDKDELQEDGSMAAFWVRHITSIHRSGNDTDADDTDIRPIYDEEPMVEVQLTAECNIFATGQHHTEQPEIITEENEHLNKENETVKMHYKDLYDSIKITRSKTIEQTTSLLANNADLKAQIQKKRPQMSKQQFTSQVDVNNNLSRPVTQQYLPKRRESIFAKPDHMIASSSSRNSSKNMPRFSLNDMVHNYYLEEARKKTKERNRNSKSSVMHIVGPQNTTKGSKPKPRSNNQTSRSLPISKSSCVTITTVPKADHSKNSSSFLDSKHFICSTCHKCVFNANHDACITKFLKEMNSRAKIQSHKTRNSNKPVELKSHTQKPSRQIFTGHRFSPNKTSVMYEKISPRSDLRWKPTGRIFKSVGLRWFPTGKLFASCTSKDDSEPTHGPNVDIPNIHESKQTLDLSASTSINVQKEQCFDLSAGTSNNVKPNNLRVWLLKKLISEKLVMSTEAPTENMIELEILFGPMFDEHFNGENQVVSKSSVVNTADASDKRQQQPDSNLSTSTLATSVSTDGNFEL